MSVVPFPPSRSARPLAVVAAGGLVLTTVLGIVAHLVPAPGLSPVSLTISDYAVSDRGWPMNLAIFLLGATSLAVPLALRAARTTVGRLVEVLLLAWCLGLITAALVPTDPLGTVELSPTGYLHRYVSVAAFVALPLATLLAVRRLAADPRWCGVVPLLRALAVVSVLGLGALYYVAFPGDRVLMGLVERLLVGTELVLLAVLVGRLCRIAAAPPARRPGPAGQGAGAPRRGGCRVLPGGRGPDTRQPPPGQGRVGEADSAVVNAVQALGVKRRTGPVVSLESRIATVGVAVPSTSRANSTQAP